MQNGNYTCTADVQPLLYIFLVYGYKSLTQGSHAMYIKGMEFDCMISAILSPMETLMGICIMYIQNN